MQLYAVVCNCAGAGRDAINRVSTTEYRIPNTDHLLLTTCYSFCSTFEKTLVLLTFLFYNCIGNSVPVHFGLKDLMFNTADELISYQDKNGYPYE